jgi:hypothetical protein
MKTLREKGIEYLQLWKSYHSAYKALESATFAEKDAGDRLAKASKEFTDSGTIDPATQRHYVKPSEEIIVRDGNDSYLIKFSHTAPTIRKINYTEIEQPIAVRVPESDNVKNIIYT